MLAHGTQALSTQHTDTTLPPSLFASGPASSAGVSVLNSKVVILREQCAVAPQLEKLKEESAPVIKMLKAASPKPAAAAGKDEV